MNNPTQPDPDQSVAEQLERILDEVIWKQSEDNVTVHDYAKAISQLKALLLDAQEKTLEDFRLFVFGRHYDGTWDGRGATFNGMVDTELREYAEYLTDQKNQVRQHDTESNPDSYTEYDDTGIDPDDTDLL